MYLYAIFKHLMLTMHHSGGDVAGAVADNVDNEYVGVRHI